jgi:hypothetical protein
VKKKSAIEMADFFILGRYGVLLPDCQFQRKAFKEAIGGQSAVPILQVDNLGEQLQRRRLEHDLLLRLN